MFGKPSQEIFDRLNKMEERIAQLEAFCSLLKSEPIDKAAIQEHINEQMTPTSLLEVEIQNKRFDPINIQAGKLEAHIWFDIIYTPRNLLKPTRAVKGAIQFMDLFGEIHFTLNLSLTQRITPGKHFRQEGIGFTYNQFMEPHKWIQQTSTKDLKAQFEVTNVIYEDGTTHSFE